MDVTFFTTLFSTMGFPAMAAVAMGVVLWKIISKFMFPMVDAMNAHTTVMKEVKDALDNMARTDEELKTTILKELIQDGKQPTAEPAGL